MQKLLLPLLITSALVGCSSMDDRGGHMMEQRPGPHGWAHSNNTMNHKSASHMNHRGDAKHHNGVIAKSVNAMKHPIKTMDGTAQQKDKVMIFEKKPE